jgi:hypothetical protein
MRDLDDDRVSQLLYAVYCAIAIIIILCSGYITLRLDNRLLRPVNIIMMWLHVTQRYKEEDRTSNYNQNLIHIGAQRGQLGRDNDCSSDN